MYKRHKIGKEGEEIAVNYLQRNGYKIIKRNFYCKQGEIDIIAKDLKSKEIVFIEVKRRCTLEYGNPADAIDRKKKKHIILSAEFFIFENKIKNCDIRFDVIEIYNNKINHIKNCEII